MHLKKISTRLFGVGMFLLSSSFTVARADVWTPDSWPAGAWHCVQTAESPKPFAVSQWDTTIVWNSVGTPDEQYHGADDGITVSNASGAGANAKLGCDLDSPSCQNNKHWIQLEPAGYPHEVGDGSQLLYTARMNDGAAGDFGEALCSRVE